MVFNRLNWDSDFFSFEVAKIESSNEKEIKSIFDRFGSKYRLIYVFTKKLLPSSILEKFNGKLVDVKQVFSKTVEFREPAITITEYSGTALNDQLKSLAYDSGVYSRFRIDERLPPRTFEKLYGMWIEQSVKSVNKIKVFIHEVDDLIAGFVTVKIKEGAGEIGLLAVSDRFRGQGIGTSLMHQVEFYLYKCGIATVTVATQKANRKANSFYKELGFHLSDSSFVYHFINNDHR